MCRMCEVENPLNSHLENLQIHSSCEHCNEFVVLWEPITDIASICRASWTDAFRAAVQYGHLPVVVWLCRNGEQSTIQPLQSAMAYFHIPMVKYLVRNGALRQGHTTADIRDLCESWARKFDSDSFNLAVSSFLFDTIVGRHLSEEDVKTIVEAAIGRCSVAQLRWLQQKGIHMDMALVRDRAVSRYGRNYGYFYRRKYNNFVQWLDTQASTAYGHSRHYHDKDSSYSMVQKNS